jgi:hypothetical protein
MMMAVGLGEPMSAIGTQRTWAFALHTSAFDPERTLAVHIGNGFDAGFCPYEGTHLSH